MLRSTQPRTAPALGTARRPPRTCPLRARGPCPAMRGPKTALHGHTQLRAPPMACCCRRTRHARAACAHAHAPPSKISGKEVARTSSTNRRFASDMKSRARRLRACVRRGDRGGGTRHAHDPTRGPHTETRGGAHRDRARRSSTRSRSFAAARRFCTRTPHTTRSQPRAHAPATRPHAHAGAYRQTHTRAHTHTTDTFTSSHTHAHPSETRAHARDRPGAGPPPTRSARSSSAA